MGLALVREAVIGPGIAALSRDLSCLAGCWGVARGSTIPVLRGIGNSPHISAVVQLYSNQKISPVTAQRQATCHAARSGAAGGQVTQQHRRLKRQSLQGAESAALRANDNDDTLGRERMAAIHAGDDHRDLHT